MQERDATMSLATTDSVLDTSLKAVVLPSEESTKINDKLEKDDAIPPQEQPPSRLRSGRQGVGLHQSTTAKSRSPAAKH